jgi:SAM-dependent methyltransferase
MVVDARRFNPGVEFVVNRAPNLSLIPDASINFLYSHIVLQHLNPSLQAAFVREFLRVLASGGIAAFQVASAIQNTRPATWRRFASLIPPPIKENLKRIAGRPVASAAIELEMHVLPDETVEKLVEAGGGTIVASPYTNSADRDHNGAIRFFDRESALRRIHLEAGVSPVLSRFYVVRRT